VTVRKYAAIATVPDREHYEREKKKIVAEIYDTAGSILARYKAEIVPFEGRWIDSLGRRDLRTRRMPHRRQPESRRSTASSKCTT